MHPLKYSLDVSTRSGASWPCWVEVNLDAIRHNVAAFRRLSGPSCRILAVVKSQAYGHGALAVSRAALEAGAGWLAVARVREGIQLRKGGIEAPILLLGPLAPAEVLDAVGGNLCLTLVDVAQARIVSEAAVVAGKVASVQVKLDTGLGRYGASLEELRQLLRVVTGLPRLRLEGLFSHFATADEPDGSYAAAQVERFRLGIEELEAEGFHFPMLHMAASAGTLAVAGSRMDMVRMGLSLYGLYPSPHLSSVADLWPALSVRSRVARLFELEAGESVGYGRTYIADRPVRAALIPIGYADGLPRCHSNRGTMLIGGRRAPIIGRVSMDLCVVDIGQCGDVQVGDPVTVIGSQGDESIGCDEFAATSGTISYEVLTSLGFRMPRVYISDGAPVGVGYLDEGRLEEWGS
jgi:alanine racemase